MTARIRSTAAAAAIAMLTSTSDPAKVQRMFDEY